MPVMPTNGGGPGRPAPEAAKSVQQIVLGPREFGARVFLVRRGCASEPSGRA
jgi:hypothetical protein